MFIPITLLFGAIGYLYYKSKNEVSLIEDELKISIKKKDEDDRKGEVEGFGDARGSVSRASRTGRTTWRVGVCAYNV